MRCARAFTLVELLVVISIIALLIALFLPSLANARFASREGKCLSQLRQIAQAQFGYAMDFDDTFAPGYVTDQPPPELYNHSWYRALRAYAGADESFWVCDIAPPRYPEIGYMNEIVPGFRELRWTDLSYGLPAFAWAKNLWEPSETFAGAMGLSFESDNLYISTDANLTPCRIDAVRWPSRFVMAGDNNNLGANMSQRRGDDIRRVGMHGCAYFPCQNTAHARVPPGQEANPADAATNQWVFGDGHALRMTYREVMDTDGRIFRRDGGFDARRQPP